MAAARIGGDTSAFYSLIYRTNCLIDYADFVIFGICVWFLAVCVDIIMECNIGGWE